MALFSRSLIPSFALPSPFPAAEPSLPPALPMDATAEPEVELLVEIVEEEEAAPDQEAMVLDEELSGTTTTASAVLKASTSRTSMIGNAFFPPRAVSRPRQSLPSAPSARAPTASRKSLSPSHAHSTSAPGTLSALPVAHEFHALKDRTASAVSSLASEKTARAGEMVEAVEKIAGLEKALEEAKLEAEGWEAECGRMKEGEGESRRAEEVEKVLLRVRGELEGEKARKRKYKDEGARLRMELGARRLKERWELGIMDVEDRMREAAMVGLEYDLAMTRMQLGLEKIHAEELEESNILHTTRLSELSASRTILLKSFDTSEATLTTLRTELASSRKLTQESKSSVAELKNSFKALEGELEDGNTRIEELENEVESLRSELHEREKMEKGDKKNEGKEVAEAKKALEKEKAKREKVEADAKELKATLKQAQSDLRDSTKSSLAAHKSADLATKAAELAQASLASALALHSLPAVLPKSKPAKAKPIAPLPSVAVLAARKRKSLSADGSDPVEAMQTDEEEEEEDHAEADESIEELKAAAKVRAKKALVVVPSRAATPVVEGPPSPLSVSSTEDLYRPVKSKSRAGRGAVDKPAKVVVVEEEGTLVAKPKKRKAPAAAEEGKKSGMLGEKSANAKSGGKKEEGATKKRKEKVLVVVDEAEEGADEPKKKKKRTLFGGPKKFEWGSIENADVNSLGLPSKLSPIKTSAGAQRASGMGMLGRGLVGRKSIFAA